MNARWVIVANAVTALIYQLHGGKLHLLTELHHLESSRKDHDLTTDRLGQYSTSYAGNVSSYSPPHDPKQIEHDKFAHQLQQHLEQARNLHQFEAVTCIAPPQFWGLLAKHCSKTLRQSIDKVIQKNLLHLPSKELEAFILLTHKPTLSPYTA